MTKRQQHLQAATNGLILAALLGGAFAAPTHAQCPPRFEVTAILQGPDCGLPGVAAFIPRGLNELGHITGCISCVFHDQKAVVWYGSGGWQYIPLPAGSSGPHCGVDISDNGIIAGWSGVSGIERAFIFDGTTSTLLPGPPPDGHFAQTYAIDADGHLIVGEWGNSIIGPGHSAMYWDNGEMVVLGTLLGNQQSKAKDVNDKGLITGWMGDGVTTGASAFILDGEKVTNIGIIKGATSVEPNAINNAATVIGTARYYTPDLIKRGFLWRDGEFTDLGVLAPWERTLGKDINDSGWVVGDLTDAPFGSGVPTEAAFLWIDGQMWRLNDLVEDTSPPQLDFAMAINNKGQILCQGRYAGNSVVAILLTPVQRPDTDLNDDCVTNVLDLIAFLGLWGDTGGVPNAADFNNDETVDVLDLLILLGHWGS